MKSRIQIANHPLHPMLVTIPAGAFVLAFIFDIVYAFGGDPIWWEATRPVMLVGVAGALIAAVPGMIDLVMIAPDHRAEEAGMVHMLLNIFVITFFGFNAYLRWGVESAPPPGRMYPELALTAIAVVMLAFSAWLGWSMVYKHRMAVLDEPIGAEDVAARTDEAIAGS